MLGWIIHIALLLALPPLVGGVIHRTKAWFAGRTGPPLFQIYFDLWKLLHKGAVYSRTAGWMFRAGPLVALAATLCAGLVTPLSMGQGPLGFEGDVVAFAYLLGLARLSTMAAALDTGSSFEGMGASREAAFSALAEPALFLALLVMAIPAGTASFAGAYGMVTGIAWWQRPELLATVFVLFAVTLAESSRIPVDDPNTHLELTMIHEVMVLDHGGPDLAFIVYGSAMKLFLFASLILHVLLPFPPSGGWLGLAMLLGGQLGVAVAVGVVESTMARLRLSRVPQFLVGASVLGAVGVLVTLVGAAR